MQFKVDPVLVYSAGKAFSLCSGGIVATILLIGLLDPRPSKIASVEAMDTALIPSCGNALKHAFLAKLSEQLDVATVTSSLSDVYCILVEYGELIVVAETK